MLDYKLKGKQVILQLDPDFLPHLSFAGIDGSPLFAKVHRQEEEGLWLETTSFKYCPTGVPRLFRPSGEAVCRAHIFIPFKAILSVVAFPAGSGRMEGVENLHQIGFRPKKGRRRKA
jgi:hypothetical protein